MNCELVSDIFVWLISRRNFLSGTNDSVIVIGNLSVPLVNFYHHELSNSKFISE